MRVTAPTKANTEKTIVMTRAVVKGERKLLKGDMRTELTINVLLELVYIKDSLTTTKTSHVLLTFLPTFVSSWPTMLVITLPTRPGETPPRATDTLLLEKSSVCNFCI